MSFFWSACLGGGIGIFYAGMAYLTQRLAVRLDGSQFMGVVVGGMLVRMLVLLVLVSLALAFLPVQPLPFAGTLVATLLIGLGLDVWWMIQHMRASRERRT